MKYTKAENVLNEIDWGTGRKFRCNSYWNDDTSFVLDIGDGDLSIANITVTMECGIMFLKFGLKMIVATSMTFQNLAEVNIFQKQRLKNYE